MKKIISIVCSLIFLFSLTSCMKVQLVFSSDNHAEFAETLYDYTIDDDKEFVGIDLRKLRSDELISNYEDGHIKGFKSFDLENSDLDKLVEFVESMYSKKTVVFLMSSKKDHVLDAMKELNKAGYKKIVGYTGTYDKFMSYHSDEFSESTGIDDCGC